MKKILFFLFVLIYSLNIQAQENEVTTYYFIRHAEKVRKHKSDKNPKLKKKGNKRAKNWSIVFDNIPFDIIYSTNYKRTIQTATPTAESKDLEVQFYNPRELYNSKFKEDTKGKTVLIVGHSNTTPQFVNKVLGSKKYVDIEDNNNSNLYVLTISNNSISDILLKID
ncbi:SixA phosphatase family protein [Lutibacter flavus]|uniref:Histidine phosphatase superfamily (Branch 1) n=1 Tax=Lutibacter flavus TaxID=691689 RepID=A0A238VNU2_9FLAO|nr:phosphoglycerate mutase family protein [Lutibacter flavus]SNR35851.1 Histidine phosphatase superfamily (branch 1) [Lutibacter flavus]